MKKYWFNKFYAPEPDKGGGGEAPEVTALMGKINASVEELLQKRNYATTDTMKEALKEALKDIDITELRSIAESNTAQMNLTIRTMAAEIQKLKELGTGTPAKKDMTIAGQIRSHIAANAEAWAKFKLSGAGNFEIPIDTRAAATMMISTNTGASAYIPQPEFVPGLVDLARNRPFLETLVNTANTSSARIVWSEKRNPDGNAGMVAEGGVKPLIDFDIVATASDARKVADKIKVSTEMLEDIDYMAAEIESELKYKVDMLVDAQLLTGDGTAPNLKGIDTYVGGYVLTTITTTEPNNADAIRAAVAQIVSLNFNPNFVALNPIDAANLDLAKASDGHYVFPPFTTQNGQTIAGVRVVETNQIPVGSFLIGDGSRYKVRNYKPFTISYGWVNDDFEKNLVTVIGERRLHAFMAGNDTGAFIYDTFAAVKTAITAA
jgi:hypothetical protein